MSDNLPIFNAGTPPANKRLASLRGRLDEQERRTEADGRYRARAKSVFGKVLRPQEAVNQILADVRRSGDKALCDYVRRLDGARLTPARLKVSAAEKNAAYRRTPRELRRALETAAARILRHQRRLLPKDAPTLADDARLPGLRCGLTWRAMRRVGVYVPGGTAAYPSSVLMNTLPAQAAGVKEIVVVSPTGPNGKLSDGVLCACEIAAVEEIYRAGGAQGVAALAYGTKTVPAVEKIVGPGNLFVTLAKCAVFGRVDIDMPAGPSEILIVSDGRGVAQPAWIAADLLSQAEHDPLAACVLVTLSRREAEAVAVEVARQMERLPRKETAAAAWRDWGLILVARSRAEMIAVANELAPEHLEVLTRNPEADARRLRTAGALFLGPYASEPLGDYLAGPSHTLPTGGTARAFSGLSVFSFLRRCSVIACDRAAFEKTAPLIEVMAAAEGLEAHRRAITARRSRQ
jgi:histidinol dehydrogenase